MRRDGRDRGRIMKSLSPVAGRTRLVAQRRSIRRSRSRRRIEILVQRKVGGAEKNLENEEESWGREEE